METVIAGTTIKIDTMKNTFFLLLFCLVAPILSSVAEAQSVGKLPQVYGVDGTKRSEPMLDTVSAGELVERITELENHGYEVFKSAYFKKDDFWVIKYAKAQLATPRNPEVVERAQREGWPRFDWREDGFYRVHIHNWPGDTNYAIYYYLVTDGYVVYVRRDLYPIERRPDGNHIGDTCISSVRFDDIHCPPEMLSAKEARRNW